MTSENGELLEKVKFLAFWVANCLFLLLLYSLLKGRFVLGNNVLSTAQAALANSLILTGIAFGVHQGVKKFDFKIKKDYFLALPLFAVFCVTLWILKRLATLTGFGISNLFFVGLIAFLLALFQIGLDRVTIQISKKFLSNK